MYPPDSPAPDGPARVSGDATLQGLLTMVSRVRAGVDAAAATRAKDQIAEVLTDITRHCDEAADCLVATGTRQLRVSRPSNGQSRPPAAIEDVDASAEACMQLARGVIDNEQESLTPVEVLAVTRAVAYLGAARSRARELPR